MPLPEIGHVTTIGKDRYELVRIRKVGALVTLDFDRMPALPIVATVEEPPVPKPPRTRRGTS